MGSPTNVAVGPVALIAERQANELLKKFASPSVDQQPLVTKTIQKFLDVNEHMGTWDFPVPTSDARVQRHTSFEDGVLIRARNLMKFVLTDFDEDEWFTRSKNSGGSSIGVPFTDTSPERKFTFPISVTARAKPLFDQYMLFDSQLKSAILYLNGQTPIGEMYNIVEGSRATTVEKNDTIRRQIAIEPTANMFLQQGLMEMLYARMKVVGLDVSVLPTEHVRRAEEASITGRQATIDFSSASDCVSIKLLRWLLPPKWFDAVMLVRCDTMSVADVATPLNMVSTMGNAGTFPLMTLTLWTLAHAVRLAKENTYSSYPAWEDLKEVSVFGDDCIVSSDLAADFIAVAEYVGFLVNREKSHIEPTDKFRESCGGDFLTGYNVRPFNLRAPTSCRLSSLEPWLYVIGNGLLKKYRSYFGDLTYMYEKRFFETLFRLFVEYKIQVKLVPDDMPDDAGLKISNDIERFVLCYPITFSEIHKSKQGSYSFKYLRFVYKTRRATNDDVRYAVWLKTPRRSSLYNALIKRHTYRDVRSVLRDYTQQADRETPKWSSNRRIGGYVVAKSVTGHWSVPGIRHLRGPIAGD